MTIYKEQMFYVHINHYHDHCALKAALYMVYKYMYNSIPHCILFRKHAFSVSEDGSFFWWTAGNPCNDYNIGIERLKRVAYYIRPTK